MEPTPSMHDLIKLKREKLHTLWCTYFDHHPPAGLRKELMVPMLAYRIQEREHGGLSHSARGRLKELASELNGGRRRGGSLLTPTYKPGTRLVRSWKGDLHEVTVVDQGFEYRGRRFDTLSVIAREITGTRWSGPVFFGLRERAGA